MKKSVLILCSLLVGSSLLAAQLLTEDFNYTSGTLLTDNGWTAHSSAGTNSPTVTSGGLTYSGYLNSGIGNAALIDNTGEDVNKTFTAQTSGTIYYSFLVRVDGIANGYFIHLMNTSSTFAARVFIQSSTGGFNFGLSNSSTGTFGSTDYSTGTTYLCIVKYDFTSTDVSLWVFSSGVPATEVAAGTAEVTNTGSGQSSIGAIALRQYSSSQNIIVDGIRVGTSWDTAPLPVELTSFTATAKGSDVGLAWQTATEVNNLGFEVQKMQGDAWNKIGFVDGNGTTNAPHSYSFVDADASGSVSYRLKQVDRDGKYEYSDVVTATVDAPADFSLGQNYPNPFNPVTNISYALPSSGFVSLKVYDILGHEVATLVNGVQEAGVQHVQFNASQLSSGLYFYTIRTGSFTATKKLLLMK